MIRARLLFLLCLFALPVLAEDFHFVRPVHVIQNQRAGKKRTPSPGNQGPITDPPEVTIGERLFIDTRFSQFFAAHYDGNVNHPIASGDPVLRTVAIRGKEVAGPFAPRSINCRSCHFVAEFAYQGIDFNRTYADFAQRSSVPQRDDGRQTTTRNSMSMVDSFFPHNGAILLHSDGEFAHTTTLIESTMTGRNFGWMPTEHDKAIAHIAKVIREDDGSDIISYRYGGAYAKILAGSDPTIHPMFRLPKQYTIDVSAASDRQILDAIAKLIAAYLESLTLARDNDGVHDGSPYDMFLKLNGLPAAPESGESDAHYTSRLAQAVDALKDPKFVDEDQQTTWFQYHQQKFNFGPEELAGLRIFLRTQAPPLPSGASMVARLLLAFPLALILVGTACYRHQYSQAFLLSVTIALPISIVLLGGWTGGHSSAHSQRTATAEAHVGNCTACHTPPDFTDRSFHNDGTSQEEFDSVHGDGAFLRLQIPSFDERSRQPNRYLPTTPQHPEALETFRAAPTSSNPHAADLGMWNIFANPDYPEPQAALRKIVCPDDAACDPRQALPRTIALFRTPTLRDLEDSGPFMHTGRFQSIEDVLRYYVRVSEMARHGAIRNGAPELRGIDIDQQDIHALAAFLRSLNEDYD